MSEPCSKPLQLCIEYTAPSEDNPERFAGYWRCEEQPSYLRPAGWIPAVLTNCGKGTARTEYEGATFYVVRGMPDGVWNGEDTDKDSWVMLGPYLSVERARERAREKHFFIEFMEYQEK
jgi:hypothetical protein